MTIYESIISVVSHGHCCEWKSFATWSESSHVPMVYIVKPGNTKFYQRPNSKCTDRSFCLCWRQFNPTNCCFGWYKWKFNSSRTNSYHWTCYHCFTTTNQAIWVFSRTSSILKKWTWRELRKVNGVAAANYAWKIKKTCHIQRYPWHLFQFVFSFAKIAQFTVQAVLRKQHVESCKIFRALWQRNVEVSYRRRKSCLEKKNSST